MKKFFNLISQRGKREKRLLGCYLDPDALLQELQWTCKTYSKVGDYLPSICDKTLFFRELEAARNKRDDFKPIKVAKLKDSEGESTLYVDFGYVSE